MTFDEVVAQSLAPETLQSVFDAYRQAQNNSDVAAQDQLPMRTMAPLLPNVTLMEHVDCDTIIYRIAGEAIVARLGFNPTGQNFLDLIAPSVRAETALTNKTGLDERCGHYSVYENQYESGRRMISESLMLPMRKTSGGRVAFIFGYHVHHKATDIGALGARTALGVRWIIADFVDIGFGVPKAPSGAEQSQGRREA
ncbi:MAG: PAS domain-containing protein [Rhodobiaceae bacterium]|nr:PAS domain-containing protein [Rhodobiaceae bacterium]